MSQTYDFDQLSVSVAGIKCEGYAVDSFITIERDVELVGVSKDLHGTPMNKYLGSVSSEGLPKVSKDLG